MSEKLEKAARGRRELMKNAVAAYAGKNSVFRSEKWKNITDRPLF